MNRRSISLRSRLACAASASAALLLGACAPLPQSDSAAANAAAASAPPVAVVKPAPPPAVPGQQTLTIGAANGFHRTIKAIAPAQVCDDTAFADGVRYGYALTWNRLIGETAVSTGKPSKRKFDASALRSQDDEYKIQWNGKERTNACASDGYLIGRIVGTHMASEDLRAGSA